MDSLNLTPVKDVTFDELTHSYLCGDKLLVGITTLMKHQGISPNYSGIPEGTLNDAATRGTSVHELFEAYEQGKEVYGQDVYSENTAGKLLQTADEQNRLLAAYKKLGLKVDAIEWLVTDHECVASMIDLVLADGSLVDIKTSSEFHADSVAYQLSFYAYLLEKDNPGFKVPHLYGLHARNGVCKLIEVQRVPDATIKAYIEAEKNGESLTDDLPEAILNTSEMLTATEEQSLAVSLCHISQLEEQLKAEQDGIAALKERIYNKMLVDGIDKMENEFFSITMKKPYTKETLDSKAIKSKYPDVYAQCTKTSEVKGNITIKIK